MTFNWTCRILGLCLGGLIPTWAAAQEPSSQLPPFSSSAWQQAEPQQQQWPAAPVSFDQPARFPALQAEEETVSAASYYDLLNRVEALETSAAEEAAMKKIDTVLKPTQKWTGRIHLDYWGFPDQSDLPNFLDTGDVNDDPEDRIGFRRIRLGIQGDINETMHYKSEIDFNEPAEPEMKDVYIGWDELPFLHTVLIGNQKRPYGLDHLNSSRYNVFLERPLTVEAFNQDARRVGLQSYGLSEDLAWNWRYGYFVMDNLANPGGQYRDNYQSEIAARLANTIWYDETSGGRGYAHWAISGSAAFPGGGEDGRFLTRPEARTEGRWFDTGVLNAHNYQLLGLEGVLNLGALSVVGEYQTVRADRFQAPTTRFGGGYVYVAYWLTGEYTPWDRESGTIERTTPLENFWLVNTCNGGKSHGWGAWQVAARYTHGDFTDEDVFGGVGNAATLGLVWWWTPNSRWQFNYTHGRISERQVAGIATDEGWYNLLGMRWSVDF